MPRTIIAQVDGSGTPLIDTPSSSAKGGKAAPPVPVARNESVSLDAVATKSKVACCQPQVPGGKRLRAETYVSPGRGRAGEAGLLCRRPIKVDRVCMPGHQVVDRLLDRFVLEVAVRPDERAAVGAEREPICRAGARPPERNDVV